VVKDTLEDRLYGFNDDVGVNALEAVISRLRRRLAAAGSAVSIESLRGIGYRLRMGGPA
jgi:DNA-binding response OmpR family regulator